MKQLSVFFLIFCFSNLSRSRAESLPPLTENNVPKTFTELWAGYDPRTEPLDVEQLHEWEEENVVLRVLRYRIGIFKGQKAMMAAVYGFPKGAVKLPGLLQIHGGGQYADSRAVLTNAKRGYATISISWAGRISSPHYRVSPREVKLFWENNTDDPLYKITTDWGALDAYHAPSRNGKNAFVSIPEAADWTLDPVPSPRNNSWFLCTLGARRALTFLENQPEVDPNKLGVYGHSMGGKLTVLTAGSDSRVKAAAPSCGGISDRYNKNPLHRHTVGDSPALQHISCPTVFLSPANDFHGHINNLTDAVRELGANPWRVVCSPHLNHRDLPEAEVATQLWFDQYLKGSFTWPETPKAGVQLQTNSGIPQVSVAPDQSRPVLAVDVYYTQQGYSDGDRSRHFNRMNRFWHHSTVNRVGKNWIANLPLFSNDLPLWIYANVTYGLDQPISGAGYYYGDYTAKTFTVSSLIQLFSTEQLKEAGVKPGLGPTPLIESFAGDWKKQWYSHSSTGWEYRTHKVYHPIWAAPPKAKLTFEVRSGLPNKFSLGLDDFAAEISLVGGSRWESFTLAPSDFKDAAENQLKNWEGLKELRLLPAEHLRQDVEGERISRLVGGNWKGALPQFRNFSWIVGSTQAEADLKPLMPTPEDTTAMWWRDGFPGKTENADWRRIVKTGRYWFLFDTDTMKVARLGPVSGGSIADVSGAELSLTIRAGGKVYRCLRGGPCSRFTGPRLIESGRFLQRADVTDLHFQADDGSALNAEARFETAAWPAELGMILAARPGLLPIRPGDVSFGKVGGGFGLDGTNELSFSQAASETPPNFTLSFWVYLPTDYQAGKAAPWLVCKNNHELAAGNFGVLIHSGGIPEVIANTGGGRDNIIRAKADNRNALKLRKWNHLAINYDGKTLGLWLNGRSAAKTATEKGFAPQRGGLTFGNRGDRIGNGIFRFRGVVDQIRIFDRALQENQLHQLERDPGGALPHLKPVREWTFRNDIAPSETQVRETWKSASISIHLSNETGKVEGRWSLPQGQIWTGETWQQAKLRLDPLTLRTSPQRSEVKVEAIELVSGERHPATFEPSVGWHRINLDNAVPIPPPNGRGPNNDAMERFRLTLFNPATEGQVARLLFEKTARGIRQRIGFPITGISAVLRDKFGNPTGIPVQLSKNWHHHPEDASVHSGQWFHGISQIRLPPGARQELELTLSYGHWGGVAAASHSQLSLIGWGGNQRWDQCALGSWGESICFSPEQNETACAITDVRPLMVAGMKSEQPWQWTHNVGGGDFFRIFDSDNNRLQRGGVVVEYLKQGPCLTEVLYAGGMNGAKISHSQIVSLSRSDDLVCGTYRISLRVEEPFEFSRFAVFQIASEDYASTRERKLAVGNEDGLLREWNARWGGNQYRGDSVECTGRIPWASLHETEGNGKGEPGGWANRGFVIREWKAKLGGRVAKPWIAEYGVDRSASFSTSLLEIVPPPGVQRLAPGDFVEAVIEHIVVPQKASDYYGPNKALRAALEESGDTWKMIHRQAVMDDLKATLKSGVLQRLYPDIRIAAQSGHSEFELRGGLGYIPVTFTHLKSHRDFRLFIDGEELDQSVHGNDFWQTNYDSRSGQWSRTYNLPSAAGQDVVRTIRFQRMSRSAGNRN